MSRLGKLRDDTDRIIMVFLVFGVAQLLVTRRLNFPTKFVFSVLL
jgi:hypothetical protein